MSSSGLLYHYIRGNYKWPRAGDGEPIRSQIGCQPKTNCLLALTEGFYLHNSNPKPKRSALAAPIAELFTSAPRRRPRPTAPPAAPPGIWPRPAQGRPGGPRWSPPRAADPPTRDGGRRGGRGEPDPGAGAAAPMAAPLPGPRVGPGGPAHSPGPPRPASAAPRRPPPGAADPLHRRRPRNGPGPRGGRRPLAGSLAQRLGREEGKAARQPF